jgi:hypothetical protein
MNLVEKCSREIERVTILRVAYTLTDVIAGSTTAPALALMTAAVEAAHNALGSGDAVAIIAAIRELEAFQP